TDNASAAAAWDSGSVSDGSDDVAAMRRRPRLRKTAKTSARTAAVPPVTRVTPAPKAFAAAPMNAPETGSRPNELARARPVTRPRYSGGVVLWSVAWYNVDAGPMKKPLPANATAAVGTELASPAHASAASLRANRQNSPDSELRVHFGRRPRLRVP